MSAGNALYEYKNIRVPIQALHGAYLTSYQSYEHFLEHGAISSTPIHSVLLLVCTTNRADLLLIGVCVVCSELKLSPIVRGTTAGRVCSRGVGGKSGPPLYPCYTPVASVSTSSQKTTTSD